MTTLQANIEHFTFEVEGLGESLLVFKYETQEFISQTFRCQLELASENSDIDFDSVVGKCGVLSIYDHDLQQVRYVHGLINQFDQVGQKKRYTHYHLELVPQLCLLNYRRHCRIFQHKKVEEIIKDVLKSANLPPDYYQINLSGSYEERIYCVQYGETDLNFIQRLMEEEGMFYFFEHTQTAHILRIADHSTVHTEITNPVIIYNESSNLVADENYAYELRYSKAIQSGGVQYSDFNFEKPGLKLEANAKAESDTHLNIYNFPGAYDTPERGHTLAKVALESHQVKKTVISGRSNCRQLLPGYLFSVIKHPRREFNQSYLLTTLIQTATQPQVLQEEAGDISSSCESRFTCIPKHVTYRPPQNSTKPRMDGVQTAIVVGPPGEEIYTDEYGRVKVQFHWDLKGENNENSSCWIRVSQNWAGVGWGGVFIPRIGQEVVVDFVNGDPDRPLITGRVYHATNTLPYQLPANKTQSGVKTRSCPNGGLQNYNELRFEDKKGNEEVYLQAEKDWNIHVKNDKQQTIDHDEMLHVAHDRNTKIDNDQTEHIFGNKTINVDKNHHENITLNMDLTVAENQNINIKKNKNDQIDKNYTITVGNNIALESGDEILYVTGLSSIIMKRNGEIHIKGAHVKVNASGTIKMKGSKIEMN